MSACDVTNKNDTTNAENTTTIDSCSTNTSSDFQTASNTDSNITSNTASDSIVTHDDDNGKRDFFVFVIFGTPFSIYFLTF